MSEADADLLSPLAAYKGASPNAPLWFQQAIQAPYERHHLDVDGADIEWLRWGNPEKPGLLLLHGNAANADWWRFTAPYWAQTHHVVALSWGGMGNSDHRPTYSMPQFLAEIRAVAIASGLRVNGRFTVLGHSFGGFPMMSFANQHPDWFKQAIILDSPFDPNQTRRPRGSGGDARPHHIYPDMATALAKFRWSPLQPSRNPFITDFIARSALKQVEGGYTWKFDPHLWSDFSVDHSQDLLRQAQCPIVLMWGLQSELLTPELVSDMQARLPVSTLYRAIPDAYHHVMVDQPLELVRLVHELL